MALIRGTRFDDSLAGSPGDDLIVGYAGNDTLSGLDGNDTLRGGLGSDVLRGNAGDDRLFDYAEEQTGVNGSLDLHNVLDGGRGDDILTSKTTVILTPTGDSPTGTPTIHQELLGGAGDDRLTAEVSIHDSSDPAWVQDVQTTVRLDGGDGQDSLTAVVTADDWMTFPGRLDFSLQLYGGGGDDSLQVTVTGGATETVTTVLDGGDGNDVIRALIQPDEFTASVAETTVNGGTGDDDILLRLDPNAGMGFTSAGLVADAGSGHDRVTVFANAAGIDISLAGGDGNDTLVFHEDASEGGANGFGSARNSIAGGAGNDTVLIDVKGIYDLDASVSGGAGNDVISLAATGQSDAASQYTSALYGNDGDDLLRFSVSGTGDELSFSSRLDGGAGNDTLAGSALADTLVGGVGADRMSGGGGNDVFVLGRDGGAEADVVTDFTSGADHFDLGAFSLSLAGLQALLAASSGNTLALSTLGGRDVVLAGLDVDDLATSDFIL